MDDVRVPRRIANAIMNALNGGVVPRMGLGYIAVGRDREIATLINDLDLIDEGNSTFRFITGEYGSGKTFLMQTFKEHAVSKGYVVADTDLSPERLLVGSSHNKKGLATFRELMANLSTKTSQTGGALEKILDIWLDGVWIEIAKEYGGSGISALEMANMVSRKINDIIFSLQNNANSYDLTHVLMIYWKAKQTDNVILKEKATRWLRGEYRLKSDAARDLGVTNIINDDDWFSYIKTYAEFFRKIGYAGFIIIIDEMINIYRCFSSVTRANNYEKLLSMYNDALQGSAEYLGIVMGGTPMSLEDPNRGIYSYDALKSRLGGGIFDHSSVINLMSPVLHIQPLTKAETFVLLEKISSIHADLYGYTVRIEEKELLEFIDYIYSYNNITPRSITRDFISLLNVVHQYPKEDVMQLLDSISVSHDFEDTNNYIFEDD